MRVKADLGLSMYLNRRMPSLHNNNDDIEIGDRSMRRYIRSVSKTMLCEVERSKDYTRLAETVRDTGENSFFWYRSH